MSEVYTFGEYIRKLRLDRHMSLKDAAHKLDMPPQKLCDIESGRRYHKRISLDLAQKVSDTFEVSLAEVVKSTQSTTKSHKNTNDILNELIPLSRVTEILSAKLVSMASEYPKELEDLAIDVCNNVENIYLLVQLICKRNITMKDKNNDKSA